MSHSSCFYFLLFPCFVWIDWFVIAGAVCLLILFFSIYSWGRSIICIYSFSGCTTILACIFNKLWQFPVIPFPDLHSTPVVRNHADLHCKQKCTRFLQRVIFPGPSSSSSQQHLPNSEAFCLPNCDLYGHCRGWILAGPTSTGPHFSGIQWAKLWPVQPCMDPSPRGGVEDFFLGTLTYLRDSGFFLISVLPVFFIILSHFY